MPCTCMHINFVEDGRNNILLPVWQGDLITAKEMECMHGLIAAQTKVKSYNVIQH